jgi:tetratricopeptide (TPR) repeat protein
MFRVLLAGLAMLVGIAHAQQRTARIDVQHYSIDAEINPSTQSLTATAHVQFVPLEDNTSSVPFELNSALQTSKVVDSSGRQISASRGQDITLNVNFPEALPKGQPATVTFTYSGRLAGTEESPVFGLTFAAIQQDYAFLLYPARWFPVSGYTADRFTSEIKVTVPTGMRAIGSGIETSENATEKIVYQFRYTQPSFPGSIAAVKGEPQRISSNGVTTALYFREDRPKFAQVYGDEIAKVMTHLTSIYGLPPVANLTVVETASGAPNGYAAPGLLFLSPRSITEQPNVRLLANQISRQWWGTLISPATRNHLWLTNGLARYSELLYLEHLNGAPAIELEVRDTFVEALTVDNPPLIQSARLEDYSPEFWASTAGKGASVLHMLRHVIGDESFGQLLKRFVNEFSWKSASTDDFRKVAEAVAKKDLQYFFLQWIESSGAPEFDMEYTVFRTQKGFRIMGKVAQDLDTFRMPVELRIETEGNPETQTVEVVGTSSEFVVDTFGKPRRIELDPNNRVLRFNNSMRVAVAIRRGEQFAEIGEYGEALKEYQKALDVNRNSSLAHYRVAEVFFLQNNYQSAANEFREALSGDLDPKWTEVWSRINLGNIFDITGQRERAVNEYQQAVRTKDNTQGAQELAAKYLKTPYERQRRSDQ